MWNWALYRGVSGTSYHGWNFISVDQKLQRAVDVLLLTMPPQTRCVDWFVEKAYKDTPPIPEKSAPGDR
jgi:hypothetical protein